MTEAKPFYKSKTFWTALGSTLLMMEPTVHQFTASNPTAFGAALSGTFLLLRFLTGQPITFKQPRTIVPSKPDVKPTVEK